MPVVLASAVVVAILAFATLGWHSRDARPTTQNSAIDSASGPTATVTTCFTPAQSCVGPIIEAINRAKAEIRVQAYGFTSQPIASALVTAHERGIDVAVILDKSNDPVTRRDDESDATLISAFGVPVFIDYRPAIAHNKVMIIDRRLVITGSYNFTSAADRRNAENVTFIESTDVAGRFLANWNSRRSVSRPFAG